MVEWYLSSTIPLTSRERRNSEGRDEKGKGFRMKASEGKTGRVFVLRLEDGDMVPECIERCAAEKGRSVGHVIVIGGIGGGQVVAGPRKTDEMPPDPVMIAVEGAHEAEGGGIIAPDKKGRAELEHP